MLASVLVTTLIGLLGAAADLTHAPGRSHYVAPRAGVLPIIDGDSRDAVWTKASWRSLDQRWLGPPLDPGDFEGRFKVAWGQDRLYVLVEITDDILFDSHRDPLVQYWDDDCLEIFLDEDFSGGDHQYNHNAFAYHLSLDNQAIDIGTDGKARAYNDHVESQWRQVGEKLIWEVAITVFGDDYVDGYDANTPRTLSVGKVLGLMLAWCDNDGSDIRENFMGSEAVHSGPTDRGWIDAGIFGQLVLGE